MASKFPRLVMICLSLVIGSLLLGVPLAQGQPDQNLTGHPSALGAGPHALSRPSTSIDSPLSPRPRGVGGDLWADVVLGKRDFTDIGPYSTVANKLHLPLGPIVARTAPSDD